MNYKKNSVALGIKIALFGSVAMAMLAQPQAWAEDAAEQSGEAVEKIAVVGSRSAPRSVGESPVPIDIIGGEEFTNQGNSDMLNLLSTMVPSFNINAQPISDAATLIRPANLRGLGPDQTLVLVNGKRRHRAAVIAFLGGGISDGAQGPDISVIPAIAIRQVEVLRDGAAAQYGSDAIAGVLNFQLKNASEGGMLEAKWGEYYDGGASDQFAGNIGLPFTDKGSANFSFEYRTADATSRSVQRDDAAALIAAGNTAVADPAQIWGSPQIKDDLKLFANIELEVSKDKQAYAFGNYAKREVEGGFYYRNPTNRSGVYAGSPVTVDGVNYDTVLVGDLTPDDGISCPALRLDANGIPIASDLAAITADANCWAFTEMLPGGFTPRFGGTVYDASIAGGVKGEWFNDIMFDMSATYGRSQADFNIKNTINPSMGPDTPTEFDPGTYVQTEIGLNLDMFREFDAGLAEPLILAGGVEWREDIFEVKAGDVASFTVGPLASQGFGIGSNGFPGFKPEAAGVFTRRNLSFYTDASAWVTDDLMLNGALRYEDFTDFGDTTNWKVSALYNLTSNISLRAAAGTGFRAPTIGQSKVINVTTAFGPNGLEDQATLPPDNPISIQKGGKPLKPEESENFSLGTVMSFGTTHVSLDYYNIKVTDRLSQTSPLTLDEDDIAALLAMGVADATSYSSILFFTNDFDTRTQGVDLVISQDLDLGRGRSKLNLVFNWNDTKVTLDPLTTNVNDTKVRQLEDNLPNTRGSLSFTHEENSWRGLARLNYYGSFWEAHLDDGELGIDEGSAVTVDLELGYKVLPSLELVLGAQNAFNKYPDENPYGGIAGAKYPTTTPYGFNGGMYYLRAVYTF
ncbi:TonB-dependent receptor plug domain-containing protein [Rheinheimera oceanensis]|uniref:TonB-dependent receptor plug domain-containing protein n=1 Tax=Rheinheimera oceanensis TaxID=2817449 RepID=UPI001BFD146E|nr:TonB-dependent receptor [Rheinheimera oceanensis]